MQQPKTTSNQSFKFDSINAALADLKAVRVVVVVADESRENEGDLICAAQFATPDMINFMAVEARGLICLAMTGDRLDELDLPLMVSNTTDRNQNAVATGGSRVKRITFGAGTGECRGSTEFSSSAEGVKEIGILFGP